MRQQEDISFFNRSFLNMFISVNLCVNMIFDFSPRNTAMTVSVNSTQFTHTKSLLFFYESFDCICFECAAMYGASKKKQHEA